VGEQDGAIVASLQLTYIPGLSRGGMRRAQIESVRVRADLRGQRIGERLIEAAIDRARQRGCGVMQLTTDLRRTTAHHFYRRLAFEASHAGMKLRVIDDRDGVPIRRFATQTLSDGGASRRVPAMVHPPGAWEEGLPRHGFAACRCWLEVVLCC